MARPPGRYSSLISGLEEQLRERFADSGWSVEVEPPGGPPGYHVDLVVANRRTRYVVELRVARESRRTELVGLLADAWVRASAGAPVYRARPLAVVGAPAISTELAAELSRYAALFLRDGAWGFVDGTGRIELHGPGLDDLRREGSDSPARPTAASPTDAFSDLGQWLLKTMVARSFPAELLNAPRVEVRAARQLAGASGVSAPTAARWAAAMRREGFLETERAFRLVRLDELLQAWRSAPRGPVVEGRYRWLLGGSNVERHLHAALARHAAGHADPDLVREPRPRACLGLFAACDRLGYGIVRGVASHLYAEDERVVGELGLVPAKEGEAAHVLVRRPAFPEALFRGCVTRDGVPTADLLQCWLDVSTHPSRGVEQAEHLYRHVIAPSLGLSTP